jgi:Tol biopolymer transport system component
MMQMRTAAALAVLAGSMAAQAQVGAQAARDLERQFRTAQYKQEVQGDVKGAIEDYKKIASGPDRALAARALFAMGVSYQALGSPDARGVFGRIVREFTEPKDVVAAARARLAELGGGRQADGAAARLALAVERGRIVGVSADGALAVGLTDSPTGGAAPQQLTLWNLASGESRILVPVSGTGVSATAPVIDANGRNVAYRWTETIDGKPVTTLRVIGTEPGAKIRVLPSPPGAAMVGPVAWSPDGGSLLVGSDQLRFLDWFSLANNGYRRIKSFEPWQQPRGFAVGQHGWIAFAARPREGSDDTHIFVMDTAGQNEIAVLNSATFSLSPLWTPDGTHLVFAGERFGAWGLWSLAVQNGRAAGDAVQLLPGRLQPVAVTRAGQLYYQTSNLNEFNQVGFVADLVAGGRLIKTFIGEGISWSPDGKLLAYIRNTGAPPAVMIRAVETGEERAYPLPRLGLQQARWLPDSAGVIVFTRDSSSSPAGAMHALNLDTGEFKRLAAVPEGRSGVVGVAPDGKSLYMIEDGAGTRKVFSVDLATGTERMVGAVENAGTTSPGVSVSPDGESLVLQVWADQAKRLSRLIIVKTDGSGTRELLGPFPSDRTQSTLTWTADGRHVLYFTTAENGHWRLMRISPAGGPPAPTGLDSTKLTGTVRIPPPAPYSPLSMDASPDGSRVVFAYRPALRSELWTVNSVLSLIGAGR